MRKKKFDGSISEIMVAYQPNQELDFGPVRKMVEFQIKNGIDGLFMGGLSTQTYLLTMEEKRRVGHSCFFDIDERCIPVGIELQVANVLRVLGSTDFR